MKEKVHPRREEYLKHGRKLQGMCTKDLINWSRYIDIKADEKRLTRFDVDIFAWIWEELLLRREKAGWANT